jgi:hypothetical protein
MTVVGMVGFQRKRLSIPTDLAPEVAALISACWAELPGERPTFEGVIARLGELHAIGGLAPSLSRLAARVAGEADVQDGH